MSVLQKLQTKSGNRRFGKKCSQFTGIPSHLQNK